MDKANIIMSYFLFEGRFFLNWLRFLQMGHDINFQGNMSFINMYVVV